MFRPHPETFLSKMKLDVFRRLNLHIRFTWGMGVGREELDFSFGVLRLLETCAYDTNHPVRKKK